MAEKRFRAPVVSALNILEEYHKDVESRLKDLGLGEADQLQIITDVYAKDDIYFSLNRPYERIKENFDDFCTNHGLNPCLIDMLSRLEKQHLYVHQAQAIESILAEQTTIIATGTGSGKTESFLIPILHYCLNQKATGLPGIKAIILYPLNALANDQIRRIAEAVKKTGIRVGCFVGSTPSYKERTTLDPDERCISRQEMIAQPPDILITNYVMLDRLMTKPETRSMFVSSEHTLKYVVIDEIHYFRGTKGANLSLLLRRLKALCKQPLVQIGASGTLRRSGGYYPDSKQDSIEQFVRLIFGREATTRNSFQLIEPVFKGFDQKDSLEPLPEMDDIKVEAFLADLDNKKAGALYEQLSGKRNTDIAGEKIENTAMYRFATQSEFISKMQDELVEGPCTFSNFVTLFCELYRKTHHNEPRNPRKVVNAYWSLINYINSRCAGRKPPMPLILDYRLHIILGDVGGSLTRCLLCKQFHDGRCSRCRYCNNGLLFKVSRQQPDLCIGYLIGQELFPEPPTNSISSVKLHVIIQILPDRLQSLDTVHPRFILEPYLDTTTDEESYFLRPAQEGEDGVVILFPKSSEDLKELPLSDSRYYWHNALKVVDALVTDEKTRTSDKILGFIDNKERASSIKIRLNDEIAERTLTAWAISEWVKDRETNLLEAFIKLEDAIHPVKNAKDYDDDEPTIKPLKEMPFWFSRMLTSIEEYKMWTISIDKLPDLRADEYELLNTVALNARAIDRTGFPAVETPLKYFSLEKSRVAREYGIGIKSDDEQKYEITSLGEQGRTYEDFINLMKKKGNDIQKMLDGLARNDFLIQKKTSKGTQFYQLHPRHLILKPTIQSDAPPEWEKSFLTVECHTADHSDMVRTEIETRFKADKIQALICTPTLEMGVDIGNLSSILLIGFPPSPANYAQRAGRAGRNHTSRLATIVVLSSAEDAHDEYYYLVPKKMIDGAITPPQFTLTNFALLASHVYAYLLAGDKKLSLLFHPTALRNAIRDFIDRDPLYLYEELGEKDFASFAGYLNRDCQTLADRLRFYGGSLIEYCYRNGIFPDYGFRHDGLSLIRETTTQTREDDVEILTTRDPEEAPRKLVPGRIVFCGGKAVKVAENQPDQTYRIQQDPTGSAYRLYDHLIADEKNEVQIEKKRDSDSFYYLSRILDIKSPLESLPGKGPLYCRIYFVHQGKLFIINEGQLLANKPLQPLSDHNGEYRFGTSIERDGLLIHFAPITPPDMRTNILAVLLRSIPDYFDLDDSELRVAKNVRLHPQIIHASDKWASFFIYGHDESSLVPFERIFEKLEEMLRKALITLQTCSCEGAGCYLCLFSLNSRTLTGRISGNDAKQHLFVYLQDTLLKPYIEPAKEVLLQPDVTLSLSLHGNECVVVAQNNLTGKQKEYRKSQIEGDQNTNIYKALQEALIKERVNGANTVKISSSLDYIQKQLSGDNDVGKGREAFFKAWLALISWKDWAIAKE